MPLPPRTSPILDSNREYIDRSPRPIVDLQARPSPLRRMRDWVGAELVPPNNPQQIKCARWSPAVMRLAFHVALCLAVLVFLVCFAF